MNHLQGSQQRLTKYYTATWTEPTTPDTFSRHAVVIETSVDFPNITLSHATITSHSRTAVEDGS